MAFIEIQNLFKHFKDVVAINRIQLEISQGEMLTLLGPSGCGKTTTLRCIAGLETPEEGDIIIDGKPMLSEGFVPSSKRGIGMVFQNYAVWPHMKVYNNIVYGLKLQAGKGDTHLHIPAPLIPGSLHIPEGVPAPVDGAHTTATTALSVIGNGVVDSCSRRQGKKGQRILIVIIGIQNNPKIVRIPGLFVSFFAG